jgi:hypothetical protein
MTVRAIPRGSLDRTGKPLGVPYIFEYVPAVLASEIAVRQSVAHRPRIALCCKSVLRVWLMHRSVNTSVNTFGRTMRTRGTFGVVALLLMHVLASVNAYSTEPLMHTDGGMMSVAKAGSPCTEHRSSVEVVGQQAGAAASTDESQSCCTTGAMCCDHGCANAAGRRRRFVLPAKT